MCSNGSVYGIRGAGHTLFHSDCPTRCDGNADRVIRRRSTAGKANGKVSRKRAHPICT